MVDLVNFVMVFAVGSIGSTLSYCSHQNTERKTVSYALGACGNILTVFARGNSNRYFATVTFHQNRSFSFKTWFGENPVMTSTVSTRSETTNVNKTQKNEK